MLIPALWILALFKLSLALGILLAFAFVTDTLDGMIARRFNLTTRFGSKLDSAADTILQASTLIWLLMLQPEVILQNSVLFWGTVGIALASMLLGFVKFGRLPNLHLYSTKIAGFFFAVFMVATFVFDGYSSALFYLTTVFGIIGSIETILLQLLSKKINENMGSLLFLFLRKSSDPG